MQDRKRNMPGRHLPGLVLAACLAMAAVIPAQATKKDVEEAWVEEDSAFRVHQVLHQLEEPYKEVFQLRVFGELSFQKIGRVFGKTESWARVTYHRARLKIQERMEKL